MGRGGRLLYRVFRWFYWTVLLSLVPVLGIILLQYIPIGHWDGLKPIIGSGQLLATCVALLAGGLKELSAMDRNTRPKRRDFLSFSIFMSALLIVFVYGSLLTRIMVSKAPLAPVTQVTVTDFSVAIFIVCLSVAACAVAVSHPRARAQSKAKGRP